jgi:CRISPR-associated endonuclease/helicase Cas3
VFRALGPLDRIVQAAGRCNREGKRPVMESRVVVFRPAEGGAPRGSYRVAMDVANRLLRQQPELHDPGVYEEFFRQAYAQDDTDARRVQRLREELDFPGVAEKMRLIEDETVSVLVRYEPAGDEYDRILHAIRSNGEMTRALWQKAQPFLVSVPRWDFEEFQKRGLVVEEAPDFWRWLAGYDPIRGIIDARVEPGELVV